MIILGGQDKTAVTVWDIRSEMHNLEAERDPSINTVILRQPHSVDTNAEDLIKFFRQLPMQITTLQEPDLEVLPRIYDRANINELSSIFAAVPPTLKNFNSYYIPYRFSVADNIIRLKMIPETIESVGLCWENVYSKDSSLFGVLRGLPAVILAKFTSFTTVEYDANDLDYIIDLLKLAPNVSSLCIVLNGCIQPSELTKFLQKLPASITSLTLAKTDEVKELDPKDTAEILNSIPHHITSVNVENFLLSNPRNYYLTENTYLVFKKSIDFFTARDVIVSKEWLDVLSHSAPIDALNLLLEVNAAVLPILNDPHASFHGIIIEPSKDLDSKTVLEYVEKLSHIDSGLAKLTCGMLLAGFINTAYARKTHGFSNHEYIGDAKLLAKGIDYLYEAAQKDQRLSGIVRDLLNDIRILNNNLPQNIYNKILITLESLRYSVVDRRPEDWFNAMPRKRPH